MTLQKDQDPGWWRRGLSRRALVIVVSLCIIAIVVGLIIVAANGIPLF